MKITTIALLTLGASLIASSGFAQEPGTTTTGTTSAPAVQPSKDVGISSRDGITLSGTDVLVTRNGLTEKLSKELELSNGLRVQSDGTVLTRDGGKLTLRSTQVLTFDGRFLNAPIVESVAPAKTTTSTVVVENPAVVIKPVTDEAARIEAERRANAVNKGPIRAGEGVQK